MSRMSPLTEAIAQRKTAMTCWERLQPILRAHRMDTELLAKLYAAVPPGIYLHYKSSDAHPMIYVVHSVSANLSGKGEPQVIYTFLYGELAGMVNHRPLFDPKEGFLTLVDSETPRFRRLRKLKPPELAIIESLAWRLAKGETLALITRNIKRALDPSLAR